MKKLMLLVALAGCSKGGDDHWKKWPVETVSGTVKGVAFTIDLPKGMRAQTSADEVEYDIDQNDRVYTPDLHIAVYSHFAKLDEYVANETDPLMRKEAAGDGFIVTKENQTYKGKQDFIVHTEQPLPDGKSLVCDARVTPFRPGDNVKDDMLPLVEKMCLSLKAK